MISPHGTLPPLLPSLLPGGLRVLGDSECTPFPRPIPERERQQPGQPYQPLSELGAHPARWAWPCPPPHEPEPPRLA